MPRSLPHLLFLLSFTAWSSLLGSTLPEVSPTPPNIILLLADDLGYNDLSSYRKTHPSTAESPPTAQTPHIDSIGRDGIRFTDFYCGAAVCSPSRAALISGRNSTRLGIYNWIPPAGSRVHLRDSEITIAELLKSVGYQTGHFGKWHLSSDGMGHPSPNEQGFDTAFYTFNNADPTHENPINFMLNGDPVGPLEGYSAQLVIDQALQWLDTLHEDAPPFFLNIWFHEPHKQWAAPPELTARHPRHPKYFGCIENMDQAVGRLLQFLESNGLEDNTLILFTSDNGADVLHSNLPLRGEKCFNLEGGIRVPFLLRWTNQVAPGQVSPTVASFCDILPTLAALARTAPPNDRAIDGTDLSAVFRGQTLEQSRDQPVFFFRYFHDPVCMLREGDWILLGWENPPFPILPDYNQGKLANLKPAADEPPWSQWGFQAGHETYIQNQKLNHFQLFHIRKDIAQENDLAAQHPEKVDRMRKTMLALHREMIDEAGFWYPQ